MSGLVLEQVSEVLEQVSAVIDRVSEIMGAVLGDSGGVERDGAASPTPQAVVAAAPPGKASLANSPRGGH